jgi:hypothetical protein
LPSKNRPLVRDGRLQAKKKRTDRSYLSSAPQPPTAVEEPVVDDVDEEVDAPDEAVDAVAAPEAVDEAPSPAAPAPAVAEPLAAAATSSRLPTTVRAMQQQGVRKRRAFDVHALAVRDSEYAIHEMRRIFILAAMVITTLIVLGFVLR